MRGHCGVNNLLRVMTNTKMHDIYSSVFCYLCRPQISSFTSDKGKKFQIQFCLDKYQIQRVEYQLAIGPVKGGAGGVFGERC